jgi:energy-coupling factor transporter ATP-binding protein EcfA2
MATSLLPIKFQIRNYKSIVDSGEVFFATDVTILAGKNECGKTAILEALRDYFPTGPEISPEAQPIDRDTEEPSISVWFVASSEQIKSIEKQARVDLPKPIKSSLLRGGLEVSYSKTSGYSLEGVIDSAIEELDVDGNIHQWKMLQQLVSQAVNLGASEMNISAGHEDVPASTALVKNWLVSELNQIQNLQGASKSARSEVHREISLLLNEIVKGGHPEARLVDAIKSHMPVPVYFTDEQNLLPFETPIRELLEHEAVKDFLYLASISAEDVRKSSGQVRRNLVARSCATVSGNFGSWYSQDKIEIVGEVDGEQLRIGVKAANATTLFRAEQRSRGFQWFLSFFIKLNSACEENSIILIDEPGLSLHAKAQRDILKMLVEICKKHGSRVVLSTHSPYFIDAERLDRVRLVEKKMNDGTVVLNKSHYGATSETLTPILTALGLDLSHALNIKSPCIVTEGMSDYYWLMTCLRISRSKVDWAVVPAVGATKIPQIVSILIGWGIDFVVLLDNDAEGNRVATELSGSVCSEEQIVFVGNADGSTVEAVFDSSDVDALLEEAVDENEKQTKRRSSGKVLVARKVYEVVLDEKMKKSISESSKQRAADLIARIKEAISKK